MWRLDLYRIPHGSHSVSTTIRVSGIYGAASRTSRRVWCWEMQLVPWIFDDSVCYQSLLRIHVGQRQRVRGPRHRPDPALRSRCAGGWVYRNESVPTASRSCSMVASSFLGLLYLRSHRSRKVRRPNVEHHVVIKFQMGIMSQ